MKPRFTSKFILCIAPVLVAITLARATPDDLPCAVVTKAGKGAQMIPPEGKVQAHVNLEVPVTCGSMVITHQDPVWLRLTDQTVVKIGAGSFVEIPKSTSKTYRIYRGEALISAPPGIYTQTWSTPNSESEFKGGVAFIQYSADRRVTTAACFNRNFEFRNKFNEKASQVVRAGEMSQLVIQNAQVTPVQPSVMSHASVSEALAGLQLPVSDQAELVAIVKQVYDERAKALVSEIAEWEPPVEAKPARQIASVKSTKKVERAVDPKEASFVAAKLRAHLYGDEEDQKEIRDNRKPASVRARSTKLKDSEKEKQVRKLNQETKKLETEIEHLNSD